jgi:hypothetical protein
MNSWEVLCDYRAGNSKEWIASTKLYRRLVKGLTVDGVISDDLMAGMWKK